MKEEIDILKKIIFVSLIVVVLALFPACGNITEWESADLRQPITTIAGNTVGEKHTVIRTETATGLTITESVEKDVPIFNKVENKAVTRPAEPPKDKKQEKWTFQQYRKHIGFDPTSAVIPSVLAIDEIVKDADTQTMYLEENGTPVEGYYGCWRIYADNSSGACLRMYISAAGAYEHDLLLLDDPVIWTVNGAAVTLAEYTTKDGTAWLAASFVLNDVGFYIETGDVSKTDFVKMVTSIINE